MKKTLALILALVLLAGLLPATALPVRAAETSPLAGKTISILGDGLSTFGGVSDDPGRNSTLAENTPYYADGKLEVARRDTWWQQAIDALGLELLVNNSAGGSAILGTDSGAPNGYDDRCVQLHTDDGREPDLIAVFLGTNDFVDYPNGLGTVPADYDTLIRDNGDGTFTYAAPATSCEAYAILLHKMTRRYENARIFCMTLLPTPTADQPTAFNAALAEIAAHFGCTVVDLETCGIGPDPDSMALYLGDGWSHPNAAGMDRITDALVCALLGAETAVCDISADLSGVALEGRAAVLHGETYTGTLTRTGGPGVMDVRIRMGGADITADCLSGTTIHIPAVTADVEITAALRTIQAAPETTLRRCTVCNDFQAPIVEPAVAPGLGTDGLTEGTRCGTCGAVLLAQQAVPAAQTDTVLPSAYVKVEFLDSSNGAYINTGLAAEPTDKFVLYASGLSNSYHSLMGSGTTSTSTDRVQVHYLQGSGFSIRFFGAMCDTVSAGVNDITTFILDLQNGTGYINGKIVLEQDQEVSPTSYPIYLFTKNTSGTIDASYTDDSRIYSYKHYRNGVLVRDMVPCFRKSDNVYGMYDLVENRFYTNAGKGSFSCDSLDLTGKGAIVMNMDTGEIYYGKNIHWQNAMASTTKVMTCVLALENLELDDRTLKVVSGDLVGGSNMGLVTGESLTVLNALYGLMLPSGNDAAQLLARTVSGSYSAFVKKMNEKAAELGMTNTHYNNTSGISDTNHYTTVYDMTLLMRHAMKNETFRKLVMTKTYQIKADGQGGKAHSLTNVNKMIGTYDGYIGGKTGTTSGSGAHLIACAERHGSRIVAMILGSDSANRYSDVITLLDYGFTQTPEHIYSTKVTAPTCTARGFTTYTCTYCGESCVDDYVDALGHDFGQWYAAEESTCTAPGLLRRDCGRCGTSETKESAVTAHPYESVVTAPTCTEPGFTTYTCPICGDTRVDDPTEALGHDYQGHVCTRCGDTLYLASGTSGDLTWTLTEDGTLTFSGTGEMENYTGNSEMPWLAYSDQIGTVVLEESAASIGDYAFYGMNITSITIPGTVTSIGSYAFKNAPLLDNVVLPAGLTRLGESAFYGCTGLTAIDIPGSLWTIQPYTFKNCTNLKAVTFQEGNLQKISDGAFYATGLTRVELPDCLDILDVYVFKNCAALEEITLSAGLTQIRSAVLYGTAIREIRIPEGVTAIHPYAFKNCAALETVELPASLTRVDEAAFYACTALNSLDLPDTVTAIGSYAFRKCAGLTDVEFPENLETIGESAFYSCTGLTALDLSSNLTSIGDYAFKGCTGVTEAVLPQDLTSIGASAFHTCTGLTELLLPTQVEALGDYAFSGSGLARITFQGDAPAIGTGAFNHVTATAAYPGGNPTWTADVMRNYGGTITWTAV